MYKIKYKITYIQRNHLYTEKPGGQFPSLKCKKKHSWKSNVPGKDSGR